MFKKSLEELMELEITSTARRLQPLNRATRAVNVITAEDIRRAGPEEYGNDSLINERMVTYEIGYL